MQATSDSRRDSEAPVFGGVILVTAAPVVKSGRKRTKPDKGSDLLTTALETSGLRVGHVSLPADGPRRGNITEAVKKLMKSAIQRVSAECGENGNRITVIAAGDAADRAVLSSRNAGQVRSFVLFSGRLSQAAKDLLTEWQSNPTLCLVSSEDKQALRDMTDVYFASKHQNSDIQVFEHMGSGLGLVDSWNQQFPERQSLAETVAIWVRRELSSVGRAREVAFMTEDGWKIFGNLLLPDAGSDRVPGVILLHSGRSDRYVFADLEPMLVRAGFAVLNIDWRGRGKSINKGKYFELSKEERANGKLDARAAIDYLSSQAGVDNKRIGFVGIIHGAEHAVRGSIGDSRVKALALLHGYVPADGLERKYLTSGKVHVMYVTSQAHKQVTQTMRELYQSTPDKLTRFLVFEGGAIGYQLFELDDRFQPAIVEWLKEALSQ